MHGLVRYGLVVAALAACHSTDTATPDGGVPADAGSTTGLAVKWTTKQAIPGDIGENIQLTSATLRFGTFVMISDSGAGGPPTIAVNFTEQWGNGGMPQDISFPDAPPGLYSKVGFQIDGLFENDSIEIYGMVRVNGSPTAEPFELHDISLTMVSLDCAVMLEPSEMLSVAVEVDFANALSSIDFSSITSVGGTRVVLPTDPQMDDFRSKLSESFRVISTQARANRSSHAEW
jgi:hypothetical protein